MERQISVEEGLLAKPYQNYGTTSDCGDTSIRNSSGSDATTAVVVFSTLVAVSGSFCYGIAVSSKMFIFAQLQVGSSLSTRTYIHACMHTYLHT